MRQLEKEAFHLGVIQAFTITRSHYDDNINLRAMSLGFVPSYELSELDEIEAAVTPLTESLASKIEDMVLPRRGSYLVESNKYLSVICGQVSVPLCPKTDSWLCFAI